MKIGIDEYLESAGITVIEWADKFQEIIPGEARWIRLRSLENDMREIEAS